MFLTAADRGNPRVAKAYDPIALPRLRALRHIVDMAAKYNVPLTMCGELAGRTVEALALLAIGMTKLSMSPPSIGPIKEMILGLDLEARPRVRRRRAGRRRHGVRRSANCFWAGQTGKGSLSRAPCRHSPKTSSTP